MDGYGKPVDDCASLKKFVCAQKGGDFEWTPSKAQIKLLLITCNLFSVCPDGYQFAGTQCAKLMSGPSQGGLENLCTDNGDLTKPFGETHTATFVIAFCYFVNKMEA